MTPNKKVQVDMMHCCNEFEYCELPDLKAKAVALPYEGDGSDCPLSMVIILPNDVNGLTWIKDYIGKVLGNGKSLVKR